MFGFEMVGFTVGTVGKVLIGLSALRVHQVVARERRIDSVVLSNLRKEKTLAIIGILLMIVGFVLEVPFKT